MGEFKSDKPLTHPDERILGLQIAIENTRRKIAEYEKSGANASEHRDHLEGLQRGLKNAQEDKAQEEGQIFYLDKRLFIDSVDAF